MTEDPTELARRLTAVTTSSPLSPSFDRFSERAQAMALASARVAAALDIEVSAARARVQAVLDARPVEIEQAADLVLLHHQEVR